MNKILFILKERLTSGGQSGGGFSSGLFNSIRFVAEMLKDYPNSEVKYVEVVDNNSIDREVSLFKPNIVFIEALWVVPEKFEVLHRLHPKVKWVIRLHSDTPFLANEGSAIDWLFKYTRHKNVFIAANSMYAVEALSGMLEEEVGYLPNYYPIKSSFRDTLHIGCFGAVRPMKNQLTQAIAAVKYADETGRRLYFHINASRIERGENALKNIRSLFEHTKHILIEHTWMNHDDFIKVVRRMDIGMQVSLSETYNIVAADFVSQNVPMVVSQEITFIHPDCQVENPKDIAEIVEKLYVAENWNDDIVDTNRCLLYEDSQEAKRTWFCYLDKMLKKKKHEM